ncbi:EPIDERMAL PATTERNING FACTOR-like protein 1 [Euphorbia lathyris]|uniref:EPIDERMAL PATTERNING FACTOR-like protein 1 n=1 Tax=Euphorbia lathyris TaxID=212925 RepID=UPI003313F8E5
MTSNFTFSLLLLLLPLFIVSSFLNQDQTPQDLLFEDKTRLGSTPPSCHNKCNRCHPCMAVQVPTAPSHDRVQPKHVVDDFFDPYPSGNRYSNYKPLGWKCRCDGHFYNP